MINREIYTRDPVENSIPNDGVAKVFEPETAEELEILRYELSSFVCEGEYERGLETILDTYMKNVGRPTQPAVWVSGFYGSGKSHLARVLEFLWRDIEFSDGATARGIVDLPEDIQAHLRELSTAGRRAGGLWSCAGTLGASHGESARLAILSILLQGAGLPGNYSQGRFVLWLRQNGFFEGVKAFVEADGRSFERELRNLYVSPHIAGGLLSVYPEFAASEREARALIKAQYPFREDVSNEEMLETMAEVLSLVSGDTGKTPCTLLVLDELQQYIGDNPDRALRVQEVVEDCSSRFGGSLLFVATGQRALQGTPQLSKLQGRFTVRVHLSDADVEEVVRRVVLRKDPEKRPELERVLDETSGEVNRHLGGTKIAPNRSDEEVLVSDYPLLPARRRFWEIALRAIDREGTSGQLRTQLKIVQEAARGTAGLPLGNVVAADFIYDQLNSDMLQSGVLLRDVDSTIRGQRDGTEDGELRSRLCALVFLIGKLPTEAGSDAGVRSTVETLADLMVEDLRAGGSELRQRIPRLLNGLVEGGDLMFVDGEYRLQTREGAEWTAAFNGAEARIRNDDGRIAGDRSRELRRAAGDALGGISLTQGDSKAVRKTELHFSAEKPPPDSTAVQVWARDGWAADERDFELEARGAGSADPVVHVFLPRRNADELKRAIAAYEAATEVISGRPAPTTREGEEARAAMEYRRASARRTLDATLQETLRGSRVLQGGGGEVSAGSDLRGAVAEACRAALDRLYPRFADGDHSSWHVVARRAREGSGDALSTIGYEGDTEKHPVCREVLRFVGGAGRKGRDARREFMAPPYGWPQDAVDAALCVLAAESRLRAQINGVPASVKELDGRNIAQADFRSETAVVSMPQRLQIRKLFGDAGINWRSDEDPKSARRLCDVLLERARDAGGEPPLLEPPDTAHVQTLRNLDGNELLLEVYNERDRLREDLENWSESAEKARDRLPRWKRLRRLLAHASDLSEAGPMLDQASAVERNRSLLEDPDPAPPLASETADLLRKSIREACGLYAEALAAETGRLDGSDAWRSLDESKRGVLLRKHRLVARDEPRLANEAAVLDALDGVSLSDWDNLSDALRARADAALTEAIDLSRPTAARVRPRGATLETEQETDEYLKELRAEIITHINNGRPVVL